MKRLLVGFALIAAACGGSSPTAPTRNDGSVSAAVAPAPPAPALPDSGPSVDPTPPVPGANSPVPVYTFSGPRNLSNCFTNATDMMQWILNVADAGPRYLRFQALALHEGTPGCEGAYKNPRARVEVTGVTDYTPHSSGQTVFTFNPRMYDCGRVQVDVSIFDAAGNEILILGTVINYGTVCTPPPPNTLVCTTVTSNPQINVPVTYSATGGTGSYSWSTPGGTPTSGSGSTYSSSYGSQGLFIATVTSGGQSATCQVTVPPTVVPDPFCSPATQSAGIFANVSVSGGGGNGTYSWSAPNSTVTSGAGGTFTTSYPTGGIYTITLTSGGVTANCQVNVIVDPQPPICAPATQTVGLNAPATFTASQGNGTFSWSAPGSSNPSGSGTNFSAAYSSQGSYTVTVTSAGQTATCLVNVTPPPLVCTPPNQTAAINTAANVSASGGTGTYAWSAPGSSTPSGSGASFSTSYAAAGSNTITVTSGSQTATCLVTVPEAPPPLVCAPPNQTVGIGGAAQVSAVGGNGTYAWSAPGGTIASGNQVNFGTSYSTAGAYTITVTSGSETATCQVDVTPPPPLVCAPVTQTVQVNQTAALSATGGTGTYAWTAPGSSTPTGTGGSFNTSYATAGTNTVTVTSGSASATCQVTVPPPTVISCLGTTATIVRPLVSPTGTVQINVPTGQQSTIDFESENHATGEVMTFTQTFSPGTSVFSLPLACFPKVVVRCGDTVLDAEQGVNSCTP